MKTPFQIFCGVQRVALTLLIVATSSSFTFGQQQVIDFEDITLPTLNSFLNASFVSDGVAFEGRVADFGIYEGFVASNVTVNQDLAVSPGSLFGQPDFLANQYSAFVPDGGATSQYGVLVFNNSEAPRTQFKGAVIAPAGSQFQSVKVANTTYAAHSMLVGDGFSDPFAVDDALTLYIMGRRNSIAIGEIEFLLADGRDVVDQFTEISLESLSGADEISFSIGSTSAGMFGLNTPTFLAIDDVTFVSIPEPSAVILLSVAAFGGSILRRRRR